MKSTPIADPLKETQLQNFRLQHPYIYIYIYIQGVPGGMCQTSGGCSLC